MLNSVGVMNSVKTLKQVSSKSASTLKPLQNSVEMFAKDTVELSQNSQKQQKTGFLKTCYNAVKSFVSLLYNGIKKLFSTGKAQQKPVAETLSQKAREQIKNLDANFTGSVKTNNSELFYENGELIKSQLKDGTEKYYKNGKLYSKHTSRGKWFSYNTLADGSRVKSEDVRRMIVNDKDKSVYLRSVDTITKPDGTQQKVFNKLVELKGDIGSNQYREFNTKVDAKTGEVLELSPIKPDNYASTVKSSRTVIENGKKVTVEDIYRGGEYDHTLKYSHDKKSGVISRTFIAKDKDGYDYLTLTAKDGIQLQAQMRKDGSIVDGSIKIFNRRTDDLIVGVGGNIEQATGVSLEKARAQIKELGLPFEI